MTIARLSNKAPLTRAACAAGLHRFMAMETPAPASMQPLSSANAILLGIGAKPDKPDRVDRVKLRERTA